MIQNGVNRREHTSTDRRAESHCDMARPMTRSGPSIAKQARLNLSLKRFHLVSSRLGMFGHTEVQQHRKMVTTHVQIMSTVPRPLGEGVKPTIRIAKKGSVVTFRANPIIGSE